MKTPATIVSKTNAPMPDLIIKTIDGENLIIDPFVGCVIKIGRFKNNLISINRFIDTEIIGKHCEIDIYACGYISGVYIPYNKNHFKIISNN